MAEENPHEKIIQEGMVYPPEVVSHWGYESEFWSRESWYKRERSLRHDMVCIYLCNLEKIKDAIDVENIGKLSSKRQRVDDPGEGSSRSTGTSGSSSGTTSKFEVGEFAAEELAEGEFRYRYALLEGMPAVNSIITALCNVHDVPNIPSRVYDIFDKVLKQWIEVKVTRNASTAVEKFKEEKEQGVNTCLVHMDPSTCVITYHGRVERMPGETKAKDFLLLRKKYLGLYMGTSEPDFFEEGDLIASIFRCIRFNKDTEDWVDSWWKMRSKDKVPLPADFPEDFKFKEFSYSDLAGYIEDTTKREDAPAMEFSGKILPFAMTSAKPTSKETDEEMVDEFLEGLESAEYDKFGKVFSEIIEAWRSRADRSHFCVSTRKECMDKWPNLAQALGIGRKETSRSDGDESLKQDEFNPPAKMKYSSWMSHLLTDLGKDHGMEERYFSELTEIESPSINPAASEVQVIRSQFYKVFGRSKVGEYCSLLKNFYSRMGGAYFEGTEEGNHGRIMYFPIYATSRSREGVTKRMISGICIRGPHHAKSATDRIAFITVERLNHTPIGREWARVIKKANLVSTIGGEHFILRQNSICKQDPCYLSFVANASYLAGNFIGEMSLNTTNVLNTRHLVETADQLLLSKREWMMERVAESVMMAVIGKSQEEGAFAIIRKIYMATLAKWRGDKPLCRDWKGLAEALNECLFDSPLCLYWAKQTRDLLLRLDV